MSSENLPEHLIDKKIIRHAQSFPSLHCQLKLIEVYLCWTNPRKLLKGFTLKFKKHEMSNDVILM